MTFFFLTNSFCQTIDLKFTAEYSDNFIELDSIKVENISTGTDTTLYYPDTVLSIILSGLEEVKLNYGDRIILSPATSEEALLNVYIPKDGQTSIHVVNQSGQVTKALESYLKSGDYTLSYTARNTSILLFVVKTTYDSQSKKIYCKGGAMEGEIQLDYNGTTKSANPLKKIESGFLCGIGDLLSINGYSSVIGNNISEILFDSLTVSKSYLFDFMGNPCNGIPTVTDIDGNVYNTVQIGLQCWMADNLNTGIMIESIDMYSDQTDNGVIEKYCYENDTANCSIYGGYYQWNEMTDYVSSDSSIEWTTQGICPVGWHIPTDEEWKELEVFLGMSQLDADNWGLRGSNQGSKLAGNDTLWFTDSLVLDNEFSVSGFNALPGGSRAYSSGSNFTVGAESSFWSSTLVIPNTAWIRVLHSDSSGIERRDNWFYYANNANSVRCIKD